MSILFFLQSPKAIKLKGAEKMELKFCNTTNYIYFCAQIEANSHTIIIIQEWKKSKNSQKRSVAKA